MSSTTDTFFPNPFFVKMKFVEKYLPPITRKSGPGYHQSEINGIKFITYMILMCGPLEYNISALEKGENKSYIRSVIDYAVELILLICRSTPFFNTEEDYYAILVHKAMLCIESHIMGQRVKRLAPVWEFKLTQEKKEVRCSIKAEIIKCLSDNNEMHDSRDFTEQIMYLLDTYLLVT